MQERTGLIPSMVLPVRNKSDWALLILGIIGAGVGFANEVKADADDSTRSLVAYAFAAAIGFVIWYLIALFVRWVYRKATAGRPR